MEFGIDGENCSEPEINNLLKNSDSEITEQGFDINLTFDKDLKNYPEIRDFINYLKNYIKKQEKKLKKLKAKTREYKSKRKRNVRSVCTQTESDISHDNTSCSQQSEKEPVDIVQEITEAAENAVQQTGFVYEATSGMYYDYNTGYYYNAEYGLYYDGNSGTYYKYNESSNSFEFHSQVAVPSQTKTGVKTKRNLKSENTDREVNSSSNIDDLISGLSRINIKNYGLSHINIRNNYRKNALEVAKAWPPCMRIIIQETNVKKLRHGMLFIITCDGGTLGREGDHAVLLPDIAVSKHHAKFSFDKDKNQYLLIDFGSRNGTLLNGKRMSVAKQESDPMEVVHGSTLQVGGTTLLCHIHPGIETCGHCEPGLLQNTEEQSQTADQIKAPSLDQQRRSELKRIQRKFGIETHLQGKVMLADGYSDRAQERRETVGSQDHNAKTETASIDQSITSDNKGFKLLSKMGWSDGQSLGKDNTGLKEPIPLVSNQGKAGLGSAEVSVPIPSDPKTERKKTMWKKTQQRYQNLPAQSVLKSDDEDDF